MPFDWDELNQERVTKLEYRKRKLEKEIQAMQKPDVNRMVAEKLGTTTQGCNCQSMLLVLVQHGEVKAYESLTPKPCHLVEVREEQSDYNRSWREATKVGEAYYERPHNFSLLSDLGPFKRGPELIPTIQINGKHYHQTPCSYADEMTADELMSEYSCPDEIKELPDGIYQILWENACYSYSTMEGEEGDGDIDFKIYNSVPLFEFMQHKENLLVEADPIGEELADRYLYIQETKQQRKKEEKHKSVAPAPHEPTFIRSTQQFMNMFGTLDRQPMPDIDLDIINPFDTMDEMESFDSDEN